ncbi:hypothetical protein ACTIVE_8970 [Actinomadura verrucosospora]|uniref:Uncharacterized protein n=1 Tax=Actinomadura verrucosospora TaxID=46165 RepID=A0A7D3VYZ9_ACTVE|nr:hypothetical protein ACTIVE_8970 [Actinomadura verrucosospora]
MLPIYARKVGGWGSVRVGYRFEVTAVREPHFRSDNSRRPQGEVASSKLNLEVLLLNQDCARIVDLFQKVWQSTGAYRRLDSLVEPTALAVNQKISDEFELPNFKFGRLVRYGKAVIQLSLEIVQEYDKSSGGVESLRGVAIDVDVSYLRVAKFEPHVTIRLER